MPFLALFKLIPGKVYLYAGIVVAVLVWFHVHNVNERTAGAAEALAPVQVLAQKAQVQIATGAAVAQSTETINGQDYLKAIAAPAPKPLGIVCYHPSGGSSEVPEAVGVTATRIGKPTADYSRGPDYDPSGPALERARKAEAQVIYLQGRVHELEKQMVNSP